VHDPDGDQTVGACRDVEGGAPHLDLGVAGDHPEALPRTPRVDLEGEGPLDQPDDLVRAIGREHVPGVTVIEDTRPPLRPGRDRGHAYAIGRRGGAADGPPRDREGRGGRGGEGCGHEPAQASRRGRRAVLALRQQRRAELLLALRRGRRRLDPSTRLHERGDLGPLGTAARAVLGVRADRGLVGPEGPLELDRRRTPGV
jgi:hypothetical protein